jgi:YYY domain-containing protein
VQALIGDAGALGLLRQALVLRLSNPWTWLLVAISIALLWYLLRRSWGEAPEVEPEPGPSFVYWIATVGFLLTLAVEFVYLRDLFGTRMNTVFKLYYQAWILLALAAAFGSYYLLGRGAPDGGTRALVSRGAWALVLVALVAAGAIYPVLAIPSKAGRFRGTATLDGMAFLEGVRPDDYAAMRWLQDNVTGMHYIVEASGGSYSDSAFISAFTGLPTVLGWDFHQYQWRGNTEESGKRQPEIEQIYQSSDAPKVLALLDKYEVEYLYVGPVETRKYRVPPQSLERFDRFLTRVYEGGAVTIFRR